MGCCGELWPCVWWFHPFSLSRVAVGETESSWWLSQVCCVGRVESRSQQQSHDSNTFNGSVRELQQVRDTGNWEHHPTPPAHRLCVKLICTFPSARPCSCRCHRRTKQALLCLLRRHYVCFRLLAASGNKAVKGPSEETCTVVSRNQTWDLSVVRQTAANLCQRIRFSDRLTSDKLPHRPRVYFKLFLMSAG